MARKGGILRKPFNTIIDRKGVRKYELYNQEITYVI
jgi:hypothetical protein